MAGENIQKQEALTTQPSFEGRGFAQHFVVPIEQPLLQEETTEPYPTKDDEANERLTRAVKKAIESGATTNEKKKENGILDFDPEEAIRDRFEELADKLHGGEANWIEKINTAALLFTAAILVMHTAPAWTAALGVSAVAKWAAAGFLAPLFKGTVVAAITASLWRSGVSVVKKSFIKAIRGVFGDMVKEWADRKLESLDRKRKVDIEARRRLKEKRKEEKAAKKQK